MLITMVLVLIGILVKLCWNFQFISSKALLSSVLFSEAGLKQTEPFDTLPMGHITATINTKSWTDAKAPQITFYMLSFKRRYVDRVLFFCSGS